MIDGRMLDYIIDFLNIVFIPAYFLAVADLLPPPLAFGAAALVLFVSCYHYANANALTEDFHFLGFPAMWSIVVFYLFFLGLPPAWNALVVLVVAVLHLVPVKFVYPTRTMRSRPLTLSFVAIWVLANAGILYVYPTPAPWLMTVSLAVMAYLGALSVVATLARPAAT